MAAKRLAPSVANGEHAPVRNVFLTLAVLIGPFANPATQASVPLRLTYEGYAVGLHVLALNAEVDLAPRTYRLELFYRTVGLYGTFVHTQSQASAVGGWNAQRPVPQLYDATGILRGDPYRAAIAFSGGLPEIRALVPGNENREPVPREQQSGTMDPLSAMVLLLRQVAGSGRCESDAKTFDGRRLSAIRARTVGEEMLGGEPHSSFSGRALRCDFEGQELAGFKRDASPEDRARPIRGSAWFAPVVPGGLPVPVRLNFETRFVGHMTLYLTGAVPEPAPSARSAVH